MGGKTSEKQRILFVDDEPSIRLTLPSALQQNGFEVRTAASVPEALVEINCSHFDALISDLNIGEEGDGFLVVSAMRHLQPECVNFILTGYPAFESALQAIHNRVDEYLVKPVDLDMLVTGIRGRLTDAGGAAGRKKLASLLLENRSDLTCQIAEQLRPASKRTNGHGEDLITRVSHLVAILIEKLQKLPATLTAEEVKTAVDYGKVRLEQGCTIAHLTRDFQALRFAIYDIIQKHLAELDTQSLLELKTAEQVCQAMIEAALTAFTAGKPSESRP
jgi:ActR/RegA family two-component response regulator